MKILIMDKDPDDDRHFFDTYNRLPFDVKQVVDVTFIMGHDDIKKVEKWEAYSGGKLSMKVYNAIPWTGGVSWGPIATLSENISIAWRTINEPET